MCRSTVIAAAFLSVLGASVASAASPGSNIVYDAEFVQLRAQHADEWAAEDNMLRDKLAQMRAKYGKPT